MPLQHEPVVLITRPQPDAERFAGVLAQQLPGVQTRIAPVVAIRQIDPGLDFSVPDSFIFTSANAVASVLRHHPATGRPAYCVGARTTAVATQAGFAAICMGEDTNAFLVAAGKTDWRGHSPLYVHGRQVTTDLVAALADLGVSATEVTAYEQVAQALPADVLDALSTGTIDVVTVFSANAARHLGAALQGRPIDPTIAFACISQRVADTLQETGVATPRFAARPDTSGMVALISEICSR